MITGQLRKSPGFLYQIGNKYYYLGKWICKECTETDATDCVMMYHMCRNSQEEPDTAMYCNKLRGHSDFPRFMILKRIVGNIAGTKKSG